jgi:arylsulfatase
MSTGDHDHRFNDQITHNSTPSKMNRRDMLLGGTTLAAAAALGTTAGVQKAVAQARQAAARKPNILVIMADDVGWFNIGAYHRGIMAGRTPNIDRLANEGMMFTDYYAEASCTAGRANFITGELPTRTGLTTVGQAGATVGMPAPPSACRLRHPRSRRL